MSSWVLQNNNGNLAVLKVDVKNLEETESNSWMLMCIKKKWGKEMQEHKLCVRVMRLYWLSKTDAFYIQPNLHQVTQTNPKIKKLCLS